MTTEHKGLRDPDYKTKSHIPKCVFESELVSLIKALSDSPNDDESYVRSVCSKCERPFGLLINNKTGQLVNGNCNSWHCPHCAAIKKWRLLQRINKGFEGDTTYMMTLTVSKRYVKNRHGAQISKYWGRFRSLMAKRGCPIGKFFKVIEYKSNKSNPDDPYLYPHLHILVTKKFNHDLIQYVWWLATEKTSHIVDVGYESIDNPSGYMLKCEYMGKGFDGMGNDGFKPGERRYTTSQDECFKPPPPSGDWSVVNHYQYSYDGKTNAMYTSESLAILGILYPKFDSREYYRQYQISKLTAERGFNNTPESTQEFKDKMEKLGLDKPYVPPPQMVYPDEDGLAGFNNPKETTFMQFIRQE